VGWQPEQTENGIKCRFPVEEKNQEIKKRFCEKPLCSGRKAGEHADF